MRIALTIVLLLLLPVNGKYHAIDETAAKFLIDLSQSLLVSSSFTGFFCLHPDNAVEFVRQISKKNVLHQIRRVLSDGRLDDGQGHLEIVHNHYFVVDMNCDGSIEFLNEINNQRLFVAPAKWVILHESINKNKTLVNIFSLYNILPDSEIIISQRINDNTMKLSSLYRPSLNHKILIENRGIWNNLDGLCLENREASSRRRMNLRGTSLKTSLVMTDLNTINHLTDYEDKLVDAVTKASYMWIAYLAERMNAEFNYSVESTWGYRDVNGTWNGMIGLLDRGEIDIGGTATFMIPQRIGVVDYVQLYTPTGSRFLFRRPPLSLISNIFTLPFANSVWLAIGGFLAISFSFICMTMRWEWSTISTIPTESLLSTDLERKPTITDNLLILLGAFFQQGFCSEPRTIAARIVILMVLLIALSLYAAYTANIVALLQSTADSIRNLDDLMNSPLKIGIFDIVYNRYYFGAFEDPVRKEFYERLVKDKPSVWLPLETGIQKVREGLFAFHVDLGFGYQIMQETFEEDEKCGIQEIDYLKVYDPLLVIQRQSPYREIIRVGALWISEIGLKPRVASKLFTQKPTCTGTTSFVSVGIHDCYAAMLAILYGCIISFGILLIEILWERCWRKPDINVLPESSNNNSRIQSPENIAISG